MVRVLIITRNVLAEQDLQIKLQRSNFEVYCSFDLLFDAQTSSKIIDYFSVVIFSDTISNLEFSRCYSIFKKRGLSILRKGNRNDLINSEFSYLIDSIDDWIDSNISNVNVTEKISQFTNKRSITDSVPYEFDDRKKEINAEKFYFSLSANEKKFLYHLYQTKKKGEYLSREKLATLIWESNPTNSNYCQLSNLANRINQKLRLCHFPEGELTTSWKKGYFIGDHLYKAIGLYVN